jgi:hypothetical protein
VVHFIERPAARARLLLAAESAECGQSKTQDSYKNE